MYYKVNISRYFSYIFKKLSAYYLWLFVLPLLWLYVLWLSVRLPIIQPGKCSLKCAIENTGERNNPVLKWSLMSALICPLVVIYFFAEISCSRLVKVIFDEGVIVIFPMIWSFLFEAKLKFLTQFHGPTSIENLSLYTMDIFLLYVNSEMGVLSFRIYSTKPISRFRIFVHYFSEINKYHFSSFLPVFHL